MGLNPEFGCEEYNMAKPSEKVRSMLATDRSIFGDEPLEVLKRRLRYA